MTPFDGQTFLFMWLGFLLLMSMGVAACFLWGIRSGQFAGQNRARYLALESHIPTDEEWEKMQREGEGRPQP